MRVLALCSYPAESAATRFRLVQFVEPLRERGIDLIVRPFLDSRQFGELYSSGSVTAKAAAMLKPLLRRAAGAMDARRYDVLLVQREAMFFGPALFERIYHWAGGMPLVLDLDDATYVRYVSPSYGRAGSLLKFFGKTDNLIRQAKLVVCGNRFIAEYVESKGSRSVVIPTVVDTDVFSPLESENEVPVLGWIGTHSTFPFLEAIFPTLERLAAKQQFKLKIVGSGGPAVSLGGVEVQNLKWALDREVADFRSLDIGLYPLFTSSWANQEWLKGKSGFKAVQYLAVGVPFVMSPVGVCAEIGVDGRTHFNAETAEDWYNLLDKLLSNPDLRRDMGAAGRRYSLEHLSVDAQADLLARALKKVVGED